MNPDYKLPIRYGLIGGMIMCVISLISYIFYSQLFGTMWSQMIYGLLSLGILIFIPVWGTVTYKHEMGKISFIQALTASMIIIFLTLLFSNVISYIISNVVDTEFPQHLFDIVRNNTAATMEKFGAQDEDIEKAMRQIRLEDFTPTVLSTLKTFGKSLGVGLLFSLLLALFVSRPSKEVEIKTEA
ncbi:MAG: DUF4199 domain-containing protein [Bacteroidetes bacterium]|nr:DUF4199 domain-containing protein [Bacteroidota bacterium]